MILVESKLLTRSSVVLLFLLILTSSVLAATQDRTLPQGPDPASIELPRESVPTQRPREMSSQEGAVSEIEVGCWPLDLFADDSGDEPPLEPLPSPLTDSLFSGTSVGARELDDLPATDSVMRNPTGRTGTDWGKTSLQSLFFLGIMHSWRLAVEPDTRGGLKGPFFKDYWNAVRHLRGWSDGDSFLTNYIGHPMMGAVSGRILLQNQPRGRELVLGFNGEYLKSRLKAFWYSALFSLQFEVGLVSEGTIGNATPNAHSRHPFSYIDIAITPAVGTAWLIGEDLLDRYVVRYLESKTDSTLVRLLVRSFLNPTRSFANLMRIKKPWYRDNRSL